MLEIKDLDKERFVKEKEENNLKYKWVVVIKPKVHKKINDFENKLELGPKRSTLFFHQELSISSCTFFLLPFPPTPALG
jgi:hypothetical protein